MIHKSRIVPRRHSSSFIMCGHPSCAHTRTQTTRVRFRVFQTTLLLYASRRALGAERTGIRVARTRSHFGNRIARSNARGTQVTTTRSRPRVPGQLRHPNYRFSEPYTSYRPESEHQIYCRLRYARPAFRRGWLTVKCLKKFSSTEMCSSKNEMPDFVKSRRLFLFTCTTRGAGVITPYGSR